MRAIRRPTALTTLLLGMILLLALGLRGYRLDGQSLWADEGNSLALAQASLADIAARTALDIHPPLYYWLLHGWTRLAGNSEVALRLPSVCASVLLVAVSYRLGRRLGGRRIGLLSAGLVALSPFQVYYAQEARMYALLALWAGLTLWAAAELWAGPQALPAAGPKRWLGLYVASASLGLYTHYAFPAVLAGAALAGVYHLWQTRRAGNWRPALALWLVAQLVPLVLYLPWLPYALRQLGSWPPPAPTPLSEALAAVWRTLTLGPTAGEGYAAWMIALGVLTLLGLVRLVREYAKAHVWLVALSAALPVGLTLILFKPAYLKFLLVAGPACCLLWALGSDWPSRWQVMRARAIRWLAGALGLGLVAAASWGPLMAYYHDPALARDDYRGLARYLEAVAGPQDAILLNAAGQHEVFGYYYRGSAPIYPLPRTRPLDEAATLAELEKMAGRANTIYAIYWATAESDPAGLIEGWLDRHAYKASDDWVGNLRLVRYAAPRPMPPLAPAGIRLGEHITLTGYQVAYPGADASAARARPGDVLRIELRWSSDAPLTRRYSVFVQALDAADHLVGQRDAPLRLTGPDWQPGQPVLDRHGLLIAPGTPPGQHRLIAGLYDADSGQRLPVVGTGADFVELGRFGVERPEVPMALAAYRVRRPLEGELNGLRLLGYERYPLGHDSEPATPLRPGAPLHVVLLWQALRQPEADWWVSMRLAPAARPGEPIAEVLAPAAGVDYPASAWQAGEVVRAQFDLFAPADARPGRYRLALRLLEAGGAPRGEALELGEVVVE